MTGLSARVVDAKNTAPDREYRFSDYAREAGNLIDQSNWGSATGLHVRLSLPGEYKSAAVEEGIYCVPSEFGSDPLALVVCARYCGAHDYIRRSFIPIPRRCRAAAVKALTSTSQAAPDVWLNFFGVSEDVHGFFSIRETVQVRS